MVSASRIYIEEDLRALHSQKMEWSGSRGPEMSNPVEMRLLVSNCETVKSQYGLL